MRLEKLEKRDLPKAIGLRKLLGPSFILLGLGLGSGELILWPYLAANWGMGIIWGAVLGISFQFFLNMEIERYTLVTGESVFVGLARKLKMTAPIWFIFSTLIPWMWPGIIASSGTIIAHILGIEYSSIIPIVLLVLIGVALTLGPVIYRTQEIFQRSLIMIGVPLVFLLAILLAGRSDWISLGEGLIGKGEGFWFLPAGISLATFLGAFAYAGAGGNLNLVQSFYIKEKGYGMGKFSGRITSILTGKKEEIKLTGTTFEINEKNLARFKIWWKRINIEHGVIFWGTGAITMVMLSLLSFATVYGEAKNEAGITFVLNQGQIIGERMGIILGIGFLVVAAAMLFSTQFSVMDATSRIMAENLVIVNAKKFKIENLAKFYYSFLWLQIAAGIIIFASGFNEPLALVTVGAVLNAFTMFVYSGLILWLNKTSLAKALQPGIVRALAVISAFVFYGVFSVFVILQAAGK
jgi:hypothetical protein